MWDVARQYGMCALALSRFINNRRKTERSLMDAFGQQKEIFYRFCCERLRFQRKRMPTADYEGEG
jgi:hypothetical protein